MVAGGLVIVVSILAAFGLDASWGMLQERETEAAHLLNLRRDFVETSARLSETEEHERRSAELALRLLGSGPSVPPEELDTALFDLWAVPTFEPVTGALGELIASGQLRLIRDELLRSSLAAWDSDVEGYRRREQWSQDNWNLFVAPYIMREMSLAQLAAGALVGGPSNDYPRDHVQLLDDPYFHNLVTHRWIAAQDVLASLVQVRARCDEIIERLEASLPGD